MRQRKGQGAAPGAPSRVSRKRGNTVQVPARAESDDGLTIGDGVVMLPADHPDAIRQAEWEARVAAAIAEEVERSPRGLAALQRMLTPEMLADLRRGVPLYLEAQRADFPERLTWPRSFVLGFVDRHGLPNDPDFIGSMVAVLGFLSKPQ